MKPTSNKQWLIAAGSAIALLAIGNYFMGDKAGEAVANDEAAAAMQAMPVITTTMKREPVQLWKKFLAILSQ